MVPDIFIYSAHPLSPTPISVPWIRILPPVEIVGLIFRNFDPEADKIDKETGQYLNGNQKVFRRKDNTYFYRCQEKLVGQVANPLRLSKNYRLGTRSLKLNKEFTTLKNKITQKLQSQQQTITEINQKLQESNRQLELAEKENQENEK
ncbi:4319_t:CDS:2, partial [Ambispora gerdemannii]